MGLKLDKIRSSIDEADLPKLAKNLSALLKNSNLNANRLAQILGIPMMTIRRLASGETTDPRISTIKLIADYFDVSIDALVDENYQVIVNSLVKSKLFLVPIVEWNTAEKLSDFKKLDLSKWKDWQSISINEKNLIGKNAFALRSRPSMYPRFPQGTIFVINPDTVPADGDIVLIRIKNNNEVTLRELIIDPPEWKLQPIVSGSNTLQYSKDHHEIVGVNLITILYNRK